MRRCPSHSGDQLCSLLCILWFIGLTSSLRKIFLPSSLAAFLKQEVLYSQDDILARSVPVDDICLDWLRPFCPKWNVDMTWLRSSWNLVVTTILTFASSCSQLYHLCFKFSCLMSGTHFFWSAAISIDCKVWQEKILCAEINWQQFNILVELTTLTLCFE